MDKRDARYKNIQKRVDKIIDDLADSYPAVAITVNNMRFRQTDMIPTAACDYKGNGIYNPDFFDGLTDLNIKAIFIHEAMHLYFNHFSRFCKTVGVDSYDDIIEGGEKYTRQARLWNIAADAYINEAILKQLPPNSLPGECVTFTTITELTEKPREEIESGSTEKVYAELLKESDEALENFKQMLQDYFEQQDQDNAESDGLPISLPGMSASQDGGSSNGDNGSAQDSGDGSNQSDSDSSSDSNDGSSESSNDGENGKDEGDKLMDKVVVVVDKEIQDIIDEVYGNSKNQTDVEKIAGEENIDSNARSKVDGTRAGKTTAHQEIDITEHVISVTNVEWKEILSEFVYSISGKATSGRTWQRPSRRYRNVYPISQGHLRKAKTRDFTFAVDVSGSMDMEKICRAFDVVMEYATENDMSCKYYFWSTTKTDVYDFTTREDFKYNLQRSYGGGTSLDCALNNYSTEGIGEGLVVVTDLEFDELTADKLNDFNGPLVFLDIEPMHDDYRETKSRFIEEIDESGNKYAKFF